MSAVDEDVVSSPETDQSNTETSAPSKTRTLAAAVVVVIVMAAAIIAIYNERHSFADTLHKVGIATMIESFALGLIGIGATYPTWREVLAGLGAPLPWGAASRVFFISQLGKYLPGSVWPTLMQMQAGRRYGAARRTMLSGGLITLLLNCCVGLLVACALLPIYNAHALAHYWWVLLALPFLLAMLHPRALTALLDKAFSLVHRPPLGERLPVRASARAAGWSVVSWLALGAHLAVLCRALGANGLSPWVLCIGAMALAVSVGVLAIPFPAGAGIREVVLVLTLAPILDSGQALALAVASRVILIVCDVALALVALIIGRVRHDARVDPAVA
jgi:uncharacterized membrane protein YbhN (UPF0104 family)